LRSASSQIVTQIKCCKNLNVGYKIMCYDCGGSIFAGVMLAGKSWFCGVLKYPSLTKPLERRYGGPAWRAIRRRTSFGGRRKPGPPVGGTCVNLVKYPAVIANPQERASTVDRKWHSLQPEAKKIFAMILRYD
jgi:hypothetical protein